MKIRSEKTKKAFIKYLEEHPDERFWQAVRNFSDYSFIYGSDTWSDTAISIKDLEDTFYKEGR